MKQPVLFIFIVFSSVILRAQNTDLPLAAANLQTLPSGSYLIAMDNTNQLNYSGNFNLIEGTKHFAARFVRQ